MKRTARAFVIAAALVGAFLLGRFTAGAGGSHDRIAAVADSEGIETARPVDPADSAGRQPEDGAAPPPAPQTVPGADAAGAAVPRPGADLRASGGPRPLLEDDLPRFTETEGRIRADGGVWSDLLDLSKKEEQDEGARRLEQLIALSIRRHGDAYTQLRLSPPHCTHSICILRGIGTGTTQNPRSDWQRLWSKIMNEPWFRDYFDDMRGSVSSDGGDTVYLTMLVRCAPGTCRFGNR
jgi:hypothetical protein